MRVLVKNYTQGGWSAEETSNDGRVTVAVWSGPVRYGEPSRSFVEVACDDTERGYTRLLESLTWLAEEIKKRKLQPVEI